MLQLVYSIMHAACHRCTTLGQNSEWNIWRVVSPSVAQKKFCLDKSNFVYDKITFVDRSNFCQDKIAFVRQNQLLSDKINFCLTKSTFVWQNQLLSDKNNFVVDKITFVRQNYFCQTKVTFVGQNLLLSTKVCMLQTAPHKRTYLEVFRFFLSKCQDSPLTRKWDHLILYIFGRVLRQQEGICSISILKTCLNVLISLEITNRTWFTWLMLIFRSCS